VEEAVDPLMEEYERRVRPYVDAARNGEVAAEKLLEAIG
jgi:hypothetical protein